MDARRARGEERERPGDDRDPVQPAEEIAAARIQRRSGAWWSRFGGLGVRKEHRREREQQQQQPRKQEALVGAGHVVKPRHVRFQESTLSQSLGRAESAWVSVCRA